MFSRRRLLAFAGLLSAFGAGALAWWARQMGVPVSGKLIEKVPLEFQWPTQNPFLFCAYHWDQFPEGAQNLGPAESLIGRDLGQDFTLKDGYRMYHGEVIPGFPVHPHRGFETITIVQQGLVDHADSLGAAGRYGEGDVQWMTAGGGIQHSEMFPLLKQDQKNPLLLFQVWLNLPQKSKMVPAHFTMFWNENIPRFKSDDGKTRVKIIAGRFNGEKALSPPPDSWAADPSNAVGIFLIDVEKGGQFMLPDSGSGVVRTIYTYSGAIEIAGEVVEPMTATRVEGEVSLVASNGASKMLILEGKPIAEPIARYGPFVMNTKEEIQQAMQDYQKTQFGGWNWPRQDMVHGEDPSRFAKFPDGHIEKPKS